MMVNPKTREQISIREDVLATLRVLAPHAQALHSLPALDEIERTAARVGNHASFLRTRFRDSGSVEAVVRASVEALRHGP
jgi:glutamate---cysteine ligase / carboxylate-amine ligase